MGFGIGIGIGGQGCFYSRNLVWVAFSHRLRGEEKGITLVGMRHSAIDTVAGSGHGDDVVV
jgi:hypothetical protein